MRNILVLGAGSAGLIAALTLKRKMPHLTVRILRSSEIGTIAVGESTTPGVPHHLIEYLGISRRQFYSMVEPTWKLGIRFLWGPRPYFNYSFEPQLDVRANVLPRPYGYYCDEDFQCINLQSALMSHDKVFSRQANGGGPEIPVYHAFHIENAKLIKMLEASLGSDIEIIEGTLKGVERGAAGISALVLEDGRRLEADFFVDASGFRSELVGKALKEPFISFSYSLFNDRAITGGWERTDEPILPYTTAETMDSGWSWKIEHEKFINRGYVYCSTAISDEQACVEFAAKNPRGASAWGSSD